MIKELLIPKIRFEEFNDDWEQHELGKIGTAYSGLSGKSKDDFGHGQAKYVTYMNVFSNPVSLKEYVEPIEIDKSQSEIEYGDILFTTSSETPDEVGMSSVWLENERNIYLNSFCFGYRAFLKTEPYYMAYMFRSDQVRKKIKFLAQGISRYNISKNKMMQIMVSIPKYKEQEKIGLYFKNIDNLISLEQEKYNKLINVKKSLLDKMFPKGDEVTPKIRFRGFCDDWETYKLGQLVIDTIDNRGKNPTYYCETGIPIIDNFMIKNNGYPDLSIATRYLDNYLFENFIRKYNEVDDVLITLVGNGIGNIALFPKTKSVIVQNTIGLRFEENKKFKYYSLLSKNSAIVKLDRGMAQPSIRQDELKDIDIEVANLEEQEKISTFLEKLDRIIIVRKQKIEKLKNVKSALLNKMFV